MNEPTTVVTDYILGAVSAWVAFQLLQKNDPARRCWALAFAALAAGAFLGGTWHGFVRSESLWKATVMTIGVTSFGMVAGSGLSVGSKLLAILAALKLVIYTGWMLFHDEFLYVVLDTGIALLVVAALHLWRWNGPMLAGVAVSVAAGLVQASGFALHEHFNHNDLYHVIQTAGVLLLYRGARRLTECVDGSASRAPSPR
jgi:hypothetical protein